MTPLRCDRCHLSAGIVYGGCDWSPGQAHVIQECLALVRIAYHPLDPIRLRVEAEAVRAEYHREATRR